MVTGERQSARMRTQYLQALLAQDVGFFDSDASTGEFVTRILSDTLLLQDAISAKVLRRIDWTLYSLTQSQSMSSRYCTNSFLPYPN